MIKQMTWAENRKEQDPDAGVDVIIIGGGATGVELAAELREASNKYIDYGFRRLDATTDIRITLLEGAPRILPPLPEKVAATATALLEERHVRVVAGCRVAQIVPGEVQDSTGHSYSYNVCVWAAAGQLEVSTTLNVKGCANIYAFGDCAACTMEDGRRVPPRAQAAHQQADYLYQAFLRQLRSGQAPSRPYIYRDYGSLVSVGSQTSVGTLMGSLKGRSWFVRGGLARVMYVSLHLLHHRAVLGWMRTLGLAMARSLIRRNTALVKLH
jgi:NADH dehydrogenase